MLTGSCFSHEVYIEHNRKLHEGSQQLSITKQAAGAMSSDSFVMVCNFFGLKPVEDVICARQNRFVTRYISTANSLCGLISRKYC